MEVWREPFGFELGYEAVTFGREDLAQFAALLERAHAVVALQEVHAGNERPDVIGLRHDVDDNPHSFDTAQQIARWEAAHGYRSTFFVLHTAGYWTDEPFFRAGLEELAVLGHEIGIHANAIAEALLLQHDPHELLWSALDQLRDWGFTVRGMAPLGDELCRISRFVNDEQFVECARPEMGEPDRELVYRGCRLKLEPMPLARFGLVYDAYRLPKGAYLSDSGGNWNVPVASLLEQPPGRIMDAPAGQLHILQHPDWWHGAFTPQEVAA